MNSKVVQILSECLGIELPPMICHENLRDPKSAYDIPPCELDGLLVGDGGLRFSFSPLGEIINREYDPSSSTTCLGEWSHNIHAPLCKWDGAVDRSQVGGWSSWNVSINLAILAFLHKIYRVFLHSWPVESLSKELMR